MNRYCMAVLHQIKFSLHTITEMIDCLDDDDLSKKTIEEKRSIGEILEHIAVICIADLLIATEATEQEMTAFYANNNFQNLVEIKEALHNHYVMLETHYLRCTEEELHVKTTSYWGTSYTKFEWLVEILAHLYHHRGQLHSILVYCYGKDPRIALFE